MGFFDRTTDKEWYDKGMKEYDGKDYNAAMVSFLEAAKSNHAEALNKVGVLYQNGYGVDIDYKLACSWYLKASKKGNYDAKNNIGFLHENGYGVKEDSREALCWYIKAQEQRNLDENITSGVLYDYANGIDSNLTLTWLYKTIFRRD